MRIEETKDVFLIDRIITHPRIYPHVSDDSCPEASSFTTAGVVGRDGVYFLTPLSGDEVVGVFMVHRHNAVMYELHTNILPKFWGRSLEAVEVLFAWVFDNTPCRKLITFVPGNNRLAYKLALKAGMTEEGIVTRSYLKNGELFDQHILGIGSQSCL